jgi:hypothetical protein
MANKATHPKHNLPTLPIWLQQPDETNAAYRGFLAFRDLGPRRTLAATAKKMRDAAKGQYNKRPPGKMDRWCSAWQWVRRAKDWDNQVQVEEDKVKIAYAAIWEKRRLESIEECYQTARGLIEKAQAMLRVPVTQQKTKDGTLIVNPAKWSFRDVAEIFKVAAELKQKACDASMPPDEDCEDIELEATVRSNQDTKAIIEAVQQYLSDVKSRDEMYRPADDDQG